MDHLLDAADDRPHELHRHPLAPGHLLEAVRAKPSKRVHHPVDQRHPLRARRVDLDEAHLRRGRLGDDQLDQRFEGPRAALVPGGVVSSPPSRSSVGSTSASTAARKQSCLSSKCR